jgi:hypothetical protein
MRIEVKDFVIEVGQDEYDKGYISFDEILYVAVERAKSQLKDDLTAHIKRMVLDDERVKAHIEVFKEKMISSLDELEEQ